MPPRVSELIFTDAARGKLGRRGITVDEAEETLRNGPVIAANPRAGETGRRFLFGRSDGGRFLTIVIEPTLEPTTWVVVTAWESTPEQRKIGRS